jgi:hypothetical protein
MKKSELELLFMDCDRLKAFCEEAKRCRPCLAASDGSKPQARIQMVEGATAKPAEDPKKGRIAAPISRRSYRQADLFRTDVSADDQLQLALRDYAKEPSSRGALLIEMAINRISSTAEPDETLRKLIEEAKHLLAEKRKANEGDAFQGDNIAGTIFADSDFHGPSLFLNISFGGLLTGYVDLGDIHFNDRVSSAQLAASADEVGGRLFLFQNDHCNGRYVKLEVGSGGSDERSSLGSFMNDRTSSVLIYREFANEIPLSIGAFVPSGTIGSLIGSQGGLSLRGDPIFTWDAFPDGSDGHPNAGGQMFIYVRIPVTVDIPHWFDYDAEIRFWISPFIDFAGELQAPISFFGAWVEGGVISSQVLDGLMQQIPNSLGAVQGVIDGAANATDPLGTFSSVYLLPGRNESSGHTDDDVTIALVKGPAPTPGPIL